MFHLFCADKFYDKKESRGKLCPLPFLHSGAAQHPGHVGQLVKNAEVFGLKWSARCCNFWTRLEPPVTTVITWTESEPLWRIDVTLDVQSSPVSLLIPLHPVLSVSFCLSVACLSVVRSHRLIILVKVYKGWVALFSVQPLDQSINAGEQKMKRLLGNVVRR